MNPLIKIKISQFKTLINTKITKDTGSKRGHTVFYVIFPITLTSRDIAFIRKKLVRSVKKFNSKLNF